MDIKSLEKSFLGKPITTLQREFGTPKSVHMITDKEYNVTKKYIYREFTVQTENNVCKRFARRIHDNR